MNIPFWYQTNARFIKAFQQISLAKKRMYHTDDIFTDHILESLEKSYNETIWTRSFVQLDIEDHILQFFFQKLFLKIINMNWI